MRFSLLTAAAAALLPSLALAADSSSSKPEVYTGDGGFSYLDLPQTAYISLLISDGYKPSAASYYATVDNTDSFIQSAFDALATATNEVIVTGALATATSYDPAQALEYLQAGITNVPEQYRSVLSSVYGEALHLQTAKAAAPPRQSNLALSAAVAGVVGGVAGIAAVL